MVEPEYAGFIYTRMSSGTSAFQQADEPVSTYMVRTAINNALHLYEQHGQVRINWGRGNTNTGIYRPAADIVADEWQHIIQFPLLSHTRLDGSPFTLRVRLAGYAAGGSSGVYGFRVAIGPSSSVNSDINDPTNNNNAAVTTSTALTSATSSWIPLSRDVLYLDARQGNDGLVTLNGKQPDGTPENPASRELWCVIQGKTTNGSRYPAVSGVLVQEWARDPIKIWVGEIP